MGSGGERKKFSLSPNVTLKSAVRKPALITSLKSPRLLIKFNIWWDVSRGINSLKDFVHFQSMRINFDFSLLAIKKLAVILCVSRGWTMREHFEKRRWEKCKDEEEKSITVRNSTPAKPSVCQIQFTIVFNFATEWILYFMLMSWAVARNTQWIMWCNTSWVLRIFCRCEKDHLRMWGERNKNVLQMYSNIIIHSISVTKIYIYISYKVQTHS